MSDDKDQQIQELTEELEKTRSSYESYKTECKQLEELLESDVKKKQSEIKKIKEDSLKKEKIYAESKTKIADMEKDLDAKTKMIAQLNAQLAKHAGNAGQADKINKIQEQNSRLVKEIQESKSRESSLQQKIKAKDDEIEALKKQTNQIKQSTQKRVKQMQSEMSQQKQIMSQEIQHLKNQLASQPKNDSKKAETKKEPASNEKSEVKQLKAENQRLQSQIDALQRDLAKARDTAQQASRVKTAPRPAQDVDNEQFKRMERTCRQLKIKLTELTEEKKNLQRSLKDNERKHVEEIAHLKEQSNIMPEESQDKQKQNSFYVLIKTKKHFISPFLQWSGKQLKLVKQTKTAFSKSLGCVKYQADYVGYDGQEVVTSINDSLEVMGSQPSSVLILGLKKVGKKAIFLSIFKSIGEKLATLNESNPDLQVKIRAYRCKSDEAAVITQNFQTGQQLSVSGLFHEAADLFSQKHQQNSPRRSPVATKNKPKSKDSIRYVSIQIGQEHRIEIITSSHCQANGFKEHDTLQNSLKHFFFDYVPAEYMCNLVSTKYVVLPISPIPQQYDNCKMSLALINQQHNVPKIQRHSSDMYEEQSPIKDDSLLNDGVKKKIENIERQNEQASLKIGRLEADCAFYRARIQDFVVRIKNIINTQNKQNPYLKKSPMTLTLVKLQQSMSSILRKTSLVGRINQDKQKYEEQPYYQENYQEEEPVHEQSVDAL